MSRALWVVMDSLGLGASPDAAAYGDAGADTFGHIAAACAEAPRGPLRLPTLTRLGLPQAHALARGRPAAGFSDLPVPESCWGYAVERACGKDTPSGHWETAGVVLDRAFGLFPDLERSFPPALLHALIDEAGLPGVLGDCHASGTEIIARLGAEHMASGKPIVYTSADSVLQIAAHETAFGLQRLYDVCLIARRLLAPYDIGRVIARPFVGTPEAGFVRTGHRRDYALPPPAPTLFDAAYTYNLGLTAGSLILDGRTGYMATVTGLTTGGTPQAIPLTGLLNIERRHGHDEFVIEKALVKMDSAAMQYFAGRRAEWAATDLFASPGPRQLWGPAAYQQPISVALNSASDSLAFKIG